MATHSNSLKSLKATAVANAFNGGSCTLTLRTGTAPGATAAASGSLLATLTLPTTAFGAATNGVITKSGTWTGTASGSGTATYFRITKGTEVLEGTVGTSGAELNLDSVGIVSGGTVTVNTFTYTIP